LFNGLSNGSTFILAYWYDTVGGGIAPQAPHVGDYAAVNGGTSCILASGTVLTISGNITQNAIFGNAFQLNGIGGTITYDGSLGTVDPCHMLVVNIFSDSGYGNIVGTSYVDTNGARYDALPVASFANLCTTQSVYVQVFYQAPGNSCCLIQTGDPYVQMGPVSTSATANDNLTFGDTYIK